MNPAAARTLPIVLALLLPASGVGSATHAPIDLTPFRPLTNSLSMVFVRVPEMKAACCIYETRVKDYAAFAAAKSPMAGTNWQHAFYHGVTPVSPGPDFPVVNVSWNEATAFCEWLTVAEKRTGTLGAKDFYRLPTDEEWSRAAGIRQRESGATPRKKSAQLPNLFPWGEQFPPPPGSGNFADLTARDFFTNWPHIANYRDGYITTAPVGSFAPNRYGLYDLAGNALEWCADFYDASHQQRVLRGGAWNNCGPKSLLTSYREHAAPERCSVVTGFRCVLQINP